MLYNICLTSPDGCHSILPGVYIFSVSDRLSLESIVLIYEEEADRSSYITCLGGGGNVWVYLFTD